MLRHRLMGVLSVLSLMLCLATVMRWVRSYGNGRGNLEGCEAIRGAVTLMSLANDSY